MRGSRLRRAAVRLGDAAGAQPPPRWLRAIATWVVIFPSVALGQWLLAPVEGVDPVGRAALVTAVVVPMSLYIGTPAVLWALAVTARLRASAEPTARCGAASRR